MGQSAFHPDVSSDMRSITKGCQGSAGGIYYFLGINSVGDDFCVLTGYALRNGRVVPLDNVEGLFTQYKDWSEAAFLNLVTTTIEAEQ